MTYLFAAYSAVWLLIFWYTLVLLNKERHTYQEIADLKRILSQRFLQRGD